MDRGMTGEQMEKSIENAVDILAGAIEQLVAVQLHNIVAVLRSITIDLQRCQLYLVCRRKGFCPFLSKVISGVCPVRWLPELDADVLMGKGK